MTPYYKSFHRSYVIRYNFVQQRALMKSDSITTRAPKIPSGSNLSKEHEKNSKTILQSLDSKIIGVCVCVCVCVENWYLLNLRLSKLTSLIILKITDTEKISEAPYARCVCVCIESWYLLNLRLTNLTSLIILKIADTEKISEALYARCVWIKNS